MAQSNKWKITTRYMVICSVSNQELITYTELAEAIKDCSQFEAAHIRRTIHIRVDETLSVTSVTDLHLPVHDQWNTKLWKK